MLGHAHPTRRCKYTPHALGLRLIRVEQRSVLLYCQPGFQQAGQLISIGQQLQRQIIRNFYLNRLHMTPLKAPDMAHTTSEEINFTAPLPIGAQPDLRPQASVPEGTAGIRMPSPERQPKDQDAFLPTATSILSGVPTKPTPASTKLARSRRARSLPQLDLHPQASVPEGTTQIRICSPERQSKDQDALLNATSILSGGRPNAHAEAKANMPPAVEGRAHGRSSDPMTISTTQTRRFTYESHL